MRIPATGLLVVAMVFAVACGADEPASAPASDATGSEVAAAATEEPTVGADEEAAVRAVAEAWWAATTPEAVCEVMSQGLKTSMAAADDCPSAIAKAVEEGHFGLEETKATVTDVVIDAPKAVVVYDEERRDEPHYLLLVKNLDDWLVDGQTNAEHLPTIYEQVLEAG